MEYRHTDHGTRAKLERVEDGRAINRWFDDRASMRDSSVVAWPIYDDDPAAEFERTPTLSAPFRDPADQPRR